MRKVGFQGTHKFGGYASFILATAIWMNYPLYCVLPSSRILHFLPDSNTFLAGESFSEENYEVGHPLSDSEYHSIDVWLQDGTKVRHTDIELGARFRFTYISRLWFLHEKELKDIAENPIGESASAQQLNEDAVKAVLSEGRFHKDTSIRYVNDVLDYGLYADKAISKGVMIGEYVGMVHSTFLKPNQYSLLYPTVEGNHQIDCREYGNASRFINHASDPNCKYVHILIEGLNHTVCVTKRDIRANEQITVNYGASYWSHMKEEYGIQPIENVDNDEYADHLYDCLHDEVHEDLLCPDLVGMCPLICISGLYACCCG